MLSVTAPKESYPVEGFVKVVGHTQVAEHLFTMWGQDWRRATLDVKNRHFEYIYELVNTEC